MYPEILLLLECLWIPLDWLRFASLSASVIVLMCGFCGDVSNLYRACLLDVTMCLMRLLICCCKDLSSLHCLRVWLSWSAL